MKRLLMDRRTFLRGAGGVAIALPFLDIMSLGCSSAPPPPDPTAAARVGRAASGFPQRFIAFFTANGTENTFKAWRPTGGETSFQLSPILEPLARHRQDLLILDGLANEVSYGGPGDAHQRGMGSCLTGVQLLEGDFPGNDGAHAGYASGISVDQEIAKAISQGTKLRSLELAVQNFGKSPYARLSYLGSNQPLPPENDPRAVFDRLFTDFNANPEEAARKAARRRTVLDAVQEDFHALNSRLGAADRRRLDEHLTAIREIEARLGSGASGSAACQKPGSPPTMDIKDVNNFPALGKLQIDLLAMALACDLTRVASIMWSRANNYMIFPWLGINEAHHDLSHHGDSDVVANEKLTEINRWFAEQLAYLIDKLKAIPEGSGTLFDHTVIFWCNEQGKGNNHSRKDMPYVLAGSAGGQFRTGRYVVYPGDTPHNNLLLSFLHAFGIEATTFGDPRYCTGPLSGLS